MTDNTENSGYLSDDMAEYLQMFLDECEEQLDDLVETMLALERDPSKRDELNEAFRLIHSMKGAAGMMGFDKIIVLTHHLENRFERFRSGLARLDEPTMNLVLRCIDYLRQCNDRLRKNQRMENSTDLVEEIKRLEEAAVAEAEASKPLSGEQQSPVVEKSTSQTAEPPTSPEFGDDLLRVVVHFRPGLQLADLKAQLIVARLAALGDIKGTQPDLDQTTETEEFETFNVFMQTDAQTDRLRGAADVDGVESIEFVDHSADSSGEARVEEMPHHTSNEPPSRALPDPEPVPAPTQSPSEAPPSASNSQASANQKTPTNVAETMRVDIDRLDNLMNLAGELVVNRARFVQISGQVNPALRKASMLDRIRDFSEGLRRTIKKMENMDDADGDWSMQVQQLQTGLELMDEQSEIWDNGRSCFSQISEAIDQLSRVSHSLHRGVLNTRMVPVSPLFNRFKRVVRDLSKERGKKVNLLIRGEKTELDKRMIDELGDPLVHLVRNSIDHGLEAPDVRIHRGKPDVGTILLEASHSGNNVYIQVGDDGSGIDVDKIKKKLVDNRVLSESAAGELSDEQALNYIWHPGFSTAKQVTDVSGRGVGMDVVKTRIHQLNGTIEIDSTPKQGTTFRIRLPLTLAIIKSLLVRLSNVILSMPIDDVREIVSVRERDIVTVHGKQTFDVRGEFIPLVRIDDVFQWRSMGTGQPRCGKGDSNDEDVEVVILHAGGKTLGLRVEELLGSQDIVIKSLSDNFVNIRGLSGASILGDGNVCLMLDVGTVIDMATRPSRADETEESDI